MDLNSISVPPLKSITKFKPLKIKNNKEITITNKDMTRFFITIKDVTREIFNALYKMQGNELFTIKKMKKTKVTNVFANFVNSSLLSSFPL